ncbi:hypothetical protein ZWY2020_010516, partial [Hordeum vulgare]
SCLIQVDSLSSLSLAPKSNLLVATSWDNQVRCWEIGNGNSQPKASISHDQPMMVPLSSGGCDKQVKMWPLLSGGRLRRLQCIGTRQANPAHVQQLPDPIQSLLKYQTRCVAAFPDQQGFLVGSIEGRVGVHHIDDSQQSKNFTFKCHREGNVIFSVNSLNFLPVHHTFATAGSDGAFNFWDKDSKQRLKVCLFLLLVVVLNSIPCSSFNNDGSIFAYGPVGAENYNPANAKTPIYLHSPQEAEVKGKPRIATGRK